MIKAIKNKLFALLEKKLSYDAYRGIRIWYEHFTTKDKAHLYRTAYFYKKKRNAKEKYCIIRLQAPGLMTFAAALQYIFVYEWARDKGYIPVLDLEFEYNYIHKLLGKDNLWEYTFEQQVSVEEALKKDWVLVESINVGDKWLPQTCLEINGRADDHYIHTLQDNWRTYYQKVHQHAEPIWRIREDILREYRNRYLGEIENKNVLGVMLRESFSAEAKERITGKQARLCYDQHPMAPGIQDTIKIVKEYAEKWKCEKIFLSTLYRESFEAFREIFGKERVLYVERDRVNLDTMKESNTSIALNAEELYKYERKNLKERTEAYIYEIMALSNCQYFIGAKCSGTIAALTFNGGSYKDIYILPDANKIKRY